MPATDLDALSSPQSNKKLKRTYASNDGSSNGDDDDDTLFSPITFGKRNEVDSYINQLHKQTRKPLTRTVAPKRPSDDGRVRNCFNTSMAMEAKVGAHSLVGTMTPNGTTRLRLSRDSDFSDSVDISYDLDHADDSSDDDDDVEASDFAEDN
ncbi:hypothetical protein SPRG_03601 [Saprolegnia parasitica CBS 223.65]|uniref:Uncharacterized protein n=1 Tax=Saprolegnia parasitica (strain CBS 223.65) TaxID=695850 RepID=A0A067CMI7_SAPPC|nr:hypothetical protein SPRG_03601 [Saprolegnia parasitica CBS 223.65]KDO31683.1 hypothetical protein SPRG_03601 [Saprolegnia parasitica CBS 223.65]|eukprot:XP_012197569.1 hypothetical protein SPRG_03601 [Saprolegnia parasitica CBS 223.65]